MSNLAFEKTDFNAFLIEATFNGLLNPVP
jgi:hypothetical protein